MGSVVGSREGSNLPSFSYYLEESDPDIVILRRQEDGPLVAAFGARGATREGLVEAAEQDFNSG
jgi:hypothetical protein